MQIQPKNSSKYETDNGKGLRFLGLRSGDEKSAGTTAKKMKEIKKRKKKKPVMATRGVVLERRAGGLISDRS